MDLQKLMDDKLVALNENGFIDKTVTAQMEKTIEGVCKDVFGEYSEFGKGLKEHIRANIGIAFENVSLQSFNLMVSDIVQTHLQGQIDASLGDKIKTVIESTLGVLDKKEWKLSDIAKLFTETLISPEDDKEVTFIIKKSRWGTTYIYFDEDADKRPYDCEYNLSIDKSGRLWDFKIKGKIPDPAKEAINGRFDNFLFKLYASDANIEIDEPVCRDIIEELQTSDWD